MNFGIYTRKSYFTDTSDSVAPQDKKEKPDPSILRSRAILLHISIAPHILPSGVDRIYAYQHDRHGAKESDQHGNK